MSRLPKIDRSGIPDELQYMWDRIGTDGMMPNIYRTIGNNPFLLRSYIRMGNGLWTQSGLDVPTRELAILRTAILVDNAYEWHQHVRIGHQAGLSNERILALHQWRQSDLFSPAERTMLGYVDAILASDHPAAEIHDELAAHFPASTVVSINLLAGFYAMTAKFLSAMEVETEGPFVGWQLEG